MKNGLFLVGFFCFIAGAGLVAAQQTPFNGTPAAVPGIIEAEDFDNGGEGVAYHDTDAGNSGGQYRPDEGVDIEACSLGGYNVGWMFNGEWLEYTVNIDTTGVYRFMVSVASESAGGNLHFELDNVAVTNTLSFSATGGWQNWTTVTANDITLSAGEHVLKFVSESDNFNINSITIAADIPYKEPVFIDTLLFSHERGFYTTSFNLQIISGLAGAQIKYTMDGSNPAASTSAQTKASPVTLTIDPDNAASRGGLTPGVVVRALTWKDGQQQSRIATHSYLFVDKVKNQTHPGGIWPDPGVNGQYWYYDLNQEVVASGQYRDYLDDALLQIPSISIVSDLGVFFDPDTGIYVNAEYHGSDWERPTSVELINPDGSTGFQIDAGIRIRGGWSRHDGYPKHAFRLFFREKYGRQVLKFPLFGDEGVDEFRKMDLRCSQNYSWSNIGNGCEFGTYTRDVFSRDLQREMGQPYTRSRYYHLYLNGEYWGLYQTQERPEAEFAQSYLGGNDNDYDVIKVDIGEDFGLYELEATDGNMDGWQEVWERGEARFNTNAKYFALEGRNSDGTVDPEGRKLVDIDNLIDYMLIIFYTGNFDAPMSKFRSNRDPNNFYAIYNRNANTGFIFMAHDCEHTIMMEPFGPGIGLAEDRVNAPFNVDRVEKSHPQWLHKRLAGNLEYRIRFADHVYKRFYNDGVMIPAKLTKIFQDRIDEIDMAIIAESARWGNMTYAKNGTWKVAVDGIINDYFPQRGTLVMDQFKTANLYPDIEPPVFSTGGNEIVGSALAIANAFELLMENPNGTTGSIMYTLDGTDPRAVGGSVSATAIDGADATTIRIDHTTLIKARINSGSAWSALHEIILYGDDAFQGLKITEIHYHPLDEGAVSGREFEFIELKNTGEAPISLSLAAFVNGIAYSFPSGTLLARNEIIVLASNTLEFYNRYGFYPAGEYGGQLDNGGERLDMVNATGDTIISVRYDDNDPWPWEPDSLGYSLELKNPGQNENPNDPASWHASEIVHGSPGVDSGDPPLSDLNHLNRLPRDYRLDQNYPNPFNPATTIRFTVKEQGKITVTVFDLLGRAVQKLADDVYAPGEYQVIWHADNYAAGIYFYQFRAANNIILTKKMVLLK